MRLWGVLDGADDDIGERAQPLGEQAQGDTLAGAWVAGEHGEAAVSDAEFDAAEVAVEGGSGEERIDGDVGPERIELEAVERQELGGHGSSGESSSWSAGASLVTKAGGSPVAA